MATLPTEPLRKRVLRLQEENAALRTLLVEILRAMKEVEILLRNRLDKDRK